MWTPGPIRASRLNVTTFCRSRTFRYSCSPMQHLIHAPGAWAAIAPDGADAGGVAATGVAWAVLAGFLILFMQAGFALVETGLCRAKNAAHTMSMSLLAFGLGLNGFFVTGYALMCGGAADPATRSGPAVLSGQPVIDKLLAIHGWGVAGYKGF